MRRHFSSTVLVLENGAKQKSHFLLCELEKPMDGLFQQPTSDWGLELSGCQTMISS
jgi:hypothetical protein